MKGLLKEDNKDVKVKFPRVVRSALASVSFQWYGCPVGDSGESPNLSPVGAAHLLNIIEQSKSGKFWIVKSEELHLDSYSSWKSRGEDKNTSSKYKVSEIQVTVTLKKETSMILT